MTSNFRKPRPKCVLSPDQRVREGRIVRSAQAALPDIAAVLHFLNSHHDGLGARPLDLAIASESGLLEVESMICAESASTRRPG